MTKIKGLCGNCRNNRHDVKKKNWAYYCLIFVYNTDRRLKRIYGKGLQISSVVDQGTTVAFTILKAKGDDHYAV